MPFLSYSSLIWDSFSGWWEGLAATFSKELILLDSICVLYIGLPCLADQTLRAPDPGVFGRIGRRGEEPRVSEHNICYLDCVGRIQCKTRLSRLDCGHS